MMATDFQAKLQQAKADWLHEMRDYRKEVTADGGDPGYTESDIVKCVAILDGLGAESRADPGDAGAVISAVKESVLALNALNRSCDGGLIETDRRQLCELIIRAAAAPGVGTVKT